ncbi:MAG: transcription antitermination factor NusB [Clostridia bacterium]|nr:transcription antitermination factor NusB [Clostridia bacterium]
MGRKQARDRSFKLIFEYIFTKEIDDELMEEYISESDVSGEEQYIRDVYFGVANKFEYLSEKIEKLAIGFSFHRIFKVDLAILLLASYEIEFMPKIPFKVSVNEACELAKLYSTEKSVGFINGILAKMKEGNDAGH